MPASLIKKFIPAALLALSLGLLLFANESKAAEKIALSIPGTGDYQAMLRKIAREFEYKNPASRVLIPDSIGSSGGIKKVLENKTRLARVARPLTEEEQKAGMTLKTFAFSPIVFVVNPYINDIKKITSNQIIKIYNGNITTWAALGSATDLDLIYPITREPGDSSLIVLNKYLGNFATQNAKVAKTKYSTPETIQTLLHYKRTFGFVPMSAALGTELNILEVDGFFPSIDNVTKGNYHFFSPFSLVYKGELLEIENDFVDFLLGPEAVKIILEYGCIPVSL